MLSDSVMEALGLAATARDRYRHEVLGVTIDEPTITLGIESQIVDFAITAANYYNEQVEAKLSKETEPLGKRINNMLRDAGRGARGLRIVVDDVPVCDDELPPGSRLTESHLHDIRRAVKLIERATKLIEGLTPEALENE